MSRAIKFKVYYEAELNGEKLKGIEEPCSWFLLTQTGQIMEYGPMRPPSRPDKGYTKLVPLFSTGLHDKNGKEIYEGDILEAEKKTGKVKFVVKFDKAYFGIYTLKDEFVITLTVGLEFYGGEVIGNIYENPELLTIQDERGE